MPHILSVCCLTLLSTRRNRSMRAACSWQYDGNLMQTSATKLSGCGQALVFLLALAASVGPALAQSPRGSHMPARPGQPATTAPGPAEPTNIDAGKNGEQLFKANCSACHKSATGLSRAGGILGVQSFLRTHYTASRESAAAIAAYLNATDAGARPGDRPARRNAKPDARPAKKDEAKPTEAKPTEAKPAEAKPAQATPEESPRPPASVPAAESKPAEPPPPPPAAPAEPKPADAPKAE